MTEWPLPDSEYRRMVHDLVNCLGMVEVNRRYEAMRMLKPDLTRDEAVRAMHERLLEESNR